MYINLLTDDYIPDEEIIREDDSGLTYFENGSWKFLEKREYGKTSDNGGSSKVRTTVIKDSTGKVVSASSDSTKTTTYRFYTNYFGLNEFKLENREFKRTSGAVTNDIAVKPGDPLKLHADFDCDKRVSVEFSILDGSKESPILPAGTDKVENEKMFFGLPQRFSGTDKAYYRNMEASEEPSGEDFADGATYTVSYTPSSAAYEVTPEHDSVRVKIIFRVYDADAKMPEVSNIWLEQGAA